MIKKIKKIPKALARRLKVLLEKTRGLDFSKKHKVEELGLSYNVAKGYEASSKDELNLILKQLDIQPTDAILDYGSGKGFAMVILSQFDFSFIAGVELSELLVKICRKNFSKLGINNMEVFNCDARELKELDRFTHFYLFNPFPEPVLRGVLQNIQESYQKKPRKITLIYNCARLRDIVSDHPFFEEIKEIKGKNWDTVIFSNKR